VERSEWWKHPRAIHSVGTFRGTSSKKPVRGTCRMAFHMSPSACGYCLWG
jgi:hypothetical protein